MSVRKRIWKSPAAASRGRHGSSITSTSTASATSRRSPRSATPTPITPSSRPTSAPASTPPTASVTVAKAAELWLESCEAAGLERTTIAAYRQHAEAAHRAADRRAPGSRNSPCRWCAPSRIGCAGRALGGDGAQCPPLARRASSPTRRAAAWWRRTWSLAAQSRRVAPRRGRRQAQGRHRNPDTRRDARDRRQLDRAGRYRPLLLTAIFTGLRASELRGLPWADVDLKRGELHVRQRADRYGALGRPKSEAGERTLPLPPMVINALREHRLACQERARTSCSRTAAAASSTATRS